MEKLKNDERLKGSPWPDFQNDVDTAEKGCGNEILGKVWEDRREELCCCPMRIWLL